MKPTPLIYCVIGMFSLGGSQGIAASALYNNPGSIVAWGENSHGQTHIPPNVTNVVAIAAGGFDNLALRNDGTVAAWDWNSDGQLNVPGELMDAVAVKNSSGSKDSSGSVLES